MKENEEINCPCKRLKCERHGDCNACRAYHNSSISKRKLFPACEKAAVKKSKPDL